MIRRLLLTLFLVLGFAFIEAQNSSLFLSYCDGKLAEAGASRQGVSVTVSAAVGFPADGLVQFAGAELTTLRIGLCTVNADMSGLTAWVRNSLSGEVIAEVALESFQSGWNEVKLPTPISIDGKQDLYLGFSYQQARSVKCLSFVGETNAQGAWIGRNGEWEDWSTRQLGSLSIEGIIEGEGLPQYNLSVLDMKLLHGEIVRDDSLRFEATIKNVASQPVSSLRFNYDLAYGLQTGSIEVEQTLQPREEATILFGIPTKGIPAGINHPVDVCLLLPDGSDDEDMTDNRCHFDYATYEAGSDFVHRALLEEFTTEVCVNCPSGAQRIEAALDYGYHDRVIMATHHAGYHTDWLTLRSDVDYCWFYNEGGSTSAPATMLDRTLTGFDKDFSPVFNPPQSQRLCERFDIALARPALVDVKATLKYDDALRQVTINIEGERLDAFQHQCSEARITVFALIDSIQAHDQTGAGQGYYHRHVTRDVLTDVWGDVIVWDGNTFSTSYVWTIPEELREEKMEVVAFVHRYDANDPTNCCVFNTTRTLLSDPSTEGIDVVTTDNVPTSAPLINLMGQKVDNAWRGFVISGGRLIIR